MKRPTYIWLTVTAFVVIGGVIAVVISGALPDEASAAAAGEKYLLKQEPDDAADVLAVRVDAEDQEDVVVVGRIGGRTNPWVKDRAAFSIVDNSLRSCNEIPGDMCPTPWDYCCEADLPKATLLVTVVDDAGKIVAHDARELLGVKELQTVVVQGKAKRDKAGNMTVLASKIHVRDANKNGNAQKPEATE